MSRPLGVAPALAVLRTDLRREIGRDAEVCATADVRGDHRWLAGVPELDPDEHLFAWSPLLDSGAGRRSAVWRQSGEVVVCVSVRTTATVDWTPAREDLATAAAIVTAMVCDQQAIADLDQTVEDLTEALGSRAVIDQAIGVIMAENRCTSQRAFAILRSASQHRNEKLRDVASMIVEQVAGSRPSPGGFRPRGSAGPQGSGRP